MLIHALQAVAQAAPSAITPTRADTAAGLFGAFARIDALGILFIAGSVALLWALIAFIVDTRDVHDVQAEP